MVVVVESVNNRNAEQLCSFASTVTNGRFSVLLVFSTLIIWNYGI